MSRWVSPWVLFGLLFGFHVVVVPLGQVFAVYGVVTLLYLCVWALVLRYSVDTKSKRLLVVYLVFWVL